MCELICLCVGEAGMEKKRTETVRRKKKRVLELMGYLLFSTMDSNTEKLQPNYMREHNPDP